MKYIIIGKFGRPHGIHGWLNVYSETHPVNAILNYKPWLIKINSAWQEIAVDDIRHHGDHFLAHIKDVTVPEEATKYTNKPIAIIDSQLPKLKKGEYYWTDLEGLTVINKEGIELGIIDHLIETSANDVMIVEGKKRYLIPFLRKRVILEIDLDKKIMKVDWSES